MARANTGERLKANDGPQTAKVPKPKRNRKRGPSNQEGVGGEHKPETTKVQDYDASQAARPPASFPLLPGEDPAAYRALYDELKRVYRPETPLHSCAIARATALLWRLGRIPKFEVAVFNSTAGSLGYLEQLTNTKLSPDTQSANFGYVLNAMIENDALTRIAHYEAALRDQLKLVSKELDEISDWHFRFDFERGDVGYSEPATPLDPAWER